VKPEFRCKSAFTSLAEFSSRIGPNGKKQAGRLPVYLPSEPSE
jgi:hypothetical protein